MAFPASPFGGLLADALLKAPAGGLSGSNFASHSCQVVRAKVDFATCFISRMGGLGDQELFEGVCVFFEGTLFGVDLKGNHIVHTPKEEGNSLRRRPNLVVPSHPFPQFCLSILIGLVVVSIHQTTK